MRRAATVSLIAATVAAAAFLLDGEPAKPKAKDVPTARQVVGYVNHQRELRNLPRLSSYGRLVRGAERWSAHLAMTGSFVHASLSLTGGLSWTAETLFRGPGGPVKSWMRSPPHRSILMSERARLIGIGRTGDVWVGRFGRAR